MDDGKNRAEKGVLYIVATPIGNLQDMTFRAVDILKSVDVIAAEDTRHTLRLLSFFHIRGTMTPCHEHNENQCADRLVEQLAAGKSVALVSNAGTPSVSDPGYRLVKKAISAGIKVVPLPGASALVTAISASAMPSDMFCFVGFPPRKKSAQDALLQGLSGRKETLVFYESPKRLLSLLLAIERHMGDRYAVMARELTKIHEEFLRGPVSLLIEELEKRASIKGEVTLLVAGKPDEEKVDSNRLEEDIRASMAENQLSPSKLAARLAKRYNVSKNEIYQEILTIKSRGETDGSDDERR
ncbi:MAG: 16S rRNA (cytidine(1402)-2'-O)-methyltransferase [Desulfosalsimonadaceae bacterium]